MEKAYTNFCKGYNNNGYNVRYDVESIKNKEIINNIIYRSLMN
jgi:hypothetical protein